ncbi:phage tail protein I [Pseudochelatococcus sp. G4_1912]|uniref:phage tail protein I n=1 Tax=Pseudochelatococcus sp. G4_1912 TaxID=3114288 RepID=UPI0039C62E25
MTLSYDDGSTVVQLVIGGIPVTVGGRAIGFGRRPWDGRRQRSLLPDPSEYEHALSEAFAAAFAKLPDAWSIPDVLSWERCPAVLLPWLAWEWSVDEWQRDWPEETQRAVIAASWGFHAVKGSAGAMQIAIGALGYGIEVTEWWQTVPPREPYTYRYKLTSPFGRPWTDSEVKSIERISLRAKNVRSWLEAVEMHVSGANVPVNCGAVVRSHIRVSPVTDPVTQLGARASLFAGVAVRSRMRVVITVQ